MPRKKLEKTAESKTETALTPAPTAPTKTEAKPKPKAAPRAKKAVVEAPVPAVVETASAPVAKAAPARRGRKPAAASVEAELAPVVAPEPVVVEAKAPTKPTGRGRKPAVAAQVKTPAEPAKRGRGRTPKAVAPATPEAVEPEPIVEAEPSVEPVAEALEARGQSRNRRGRSRGRGGSGAQERTAPVAQTVEPAAPAVEIEEIDYDSYDFPVPTWRTRSSESARRPEARKPEIVATEASPAPQAESRADSESHGRNRRRRRGRDDRNEAPAPKPVAASVEVAPAPQPEVKLEPVAKPEPVAPTPAVPAETPVRRERVVPKVPEKAAIPIPDDAPQVVVRNGVPTLVRNHHIIPPIMFFGSPSDERRADTVMEEVRMASEAGVHLHSYLIDFEVSPNAVNEAAAFAAYILSRSVDVDPNSQVVFRLVFQAPRGWENRYPNAKYRNTDGSLAEPSVCDDEFWTAAGNCLEQFVKKMRLLDHRDHILGVHLERGEWFFSEGAGYDDSKAAQAKFRDWARTRYLNDEVTLRASWFDGGASFENIQIPEYLPEGEEGDKFIRSSRRQRKYVDYHLFLSDATVYRIADLAYIAKAASGGMFLIGASYGYTFEWSHPASGHLSLGKLLRAPEIDFIAGPPSYRTRQPGGSAAFPGPIDSFALNGKLYISEEDFKTSLSIGHEPDDFNPQLKTPQALESVHWRGVGAALAHASGVAWMDLWGNGWLRTHSVWERAKKVREALIDRIGTPLDDPEVAVFIDERALAYLVDDHAFKLLVQNVRESVLRAGVSAAFYLLSDLAHREKFPESKLYLFVNAWDIRPDLRAAIKSRLQRDNKVLFWLYSAGLFDAGRESLERAREVTGIALKPQPFYSRAGTTILNRRHPLSEAFPDKNLVGGTKLEPSYFAIPEGATVLGEYTQTGLPSFVVKEFNDGPTETHWTSVFLGEPQVNPALIRALAQMAGAHVWNFHEDVVHVRHPFCTVHCQGAGQRTLTLPGKYSAYNLLNNEWSAVDSSHLKFAAVEGATYCFLVGARHELEQQLSADTSKLLYMEELPPRDSNVRVDSTNFDVPMMKLDEWIEGNDGDDNADEWFLRPQPAEEEPIAQAQAEESPERVGRRRRHRRGGKNGNGSDREGGYGDSRPSFGSTGTTTESFGDLDMNVMFRKRE